MPAVRTRPVDNVCGLWCNQVVIGGTVAAWQTDSGAVCETPSSRADETDARCGWAAAESGRGETSVCTADVQLVASAATTGRRAASCWPSGHLQQRTVYSTPHRRQLSASEYLLCLSVLLLCSRSYRVEALSDDARLTSVCLSVAYIGPKSRTKRHRKTKMGTEVAHVSRDSDTTFKVKRSKINLQGRGILWRPPAQLIVCKFVKRFIHGATDWFPDSFIYLSVCLYLPRYLPT